MKGNTIQKIEQKIEINEAENHGKFCVCPIYRFSGSEYIYVDNAINGLGKAYNTEREALKVLKAAAKRGEACVIVKFYSRSTITREIKQEKKTIRKGAKREFAVFSLPKDKSTRKVYYWGTIDGVDRTDAFSNLKMNNLWFELSKEIFLYILKDGRLQNNYFPGIPIIDAYSEKEGVIGGSVEGCTRKPLEEVLPNVKNESGRGEDRPEERIQEDDKVDSER